MPVTTKTTSDIFGKDVFTTKGVFCGRVVDCNINLTKFRLQSITLDVAKGSFLSGLIGDKKGVIIPFSYVDAVGDVVVIKHLSAPALEEKEDPEQPEQQQSMSMF